MPYFYQYSQTLRQLPGMVQKQDEDADINRIKVHTSKEIK
jgi:hypothetical protein